MVNCVHNVMTMVFLHALITLVNVVAIHISMVSFVNYNNSLALSATQRMNVELMSISLVFNSSNVDVSDFLLKFISSCNNFFSASSTPSVLIDLTVAGYGNGSSGNDNMGLWSPQSVSLMPNGDFYVADANNNRVQFFPSGSRLGQTVAGNSNGTQGSTSTELWFPGGMYVNIPSDAARSRRSRCTPIIEKKNNYNSVKQEIYRGESIEVCCISV